MVEISAVDPDPYGSASFWYAGSASDPHQIDQLDPEPDPHQFAEDKPKCLEYEYNTFSRILAFIWKLGSGSGSRSALG